MNEKTENYQQEEFNRTHSGMYELIQAERHNLDVDPDRIEITECHKVETKKRIFAIDVIDLNNEYLDLDIEAKNYKDAVHKVRAWASMTNRLFGTTWKLGSIREIKDGDEDRR